MLRSLQKKWTRPRKSHTMSVDVILEDAFEFTILGHEVNVNNCKSVEAHLSGAFYSNTPDSLDLLHNSTNDKVED